MLHSHAPPRIVPISCSSLSPVISQHALSLILGILKKAKSKTRPAARAYPKYRAGSRVLCRHHASRSSLDYAGSQRGTVGPPPFLQSLMSPSIASCAPLIGRLPPYLSRFDPCLDPCLDPCVSTSVTSASSDVIFLASVGITVGPSSFLLNHV